MSVADSVRLRVRVRLSVGLRVGDGDTGLNGMGVSVGLLVCDNGGLAVNIHVDNVVGLGVCVAVAQNNVLDRGGLHICVSPPNFNNHNYQM